MDTVTYYLHFDQQISILTEGISMDIAGGGVVLFFFFFNVMCGFPVETGSD